MRVKCIVDVDVILQYTMIVLCPCECIITLKKCLAQVPIVYFFFSSYKNVIYTYCLAKKKKEFEYVKTIQYVRRGHIIPEYHPILSPVS